MDLTQDLYELEKSIDMLMYALDLKIILFYIVPIILIILLFILVCLSIKQYQILLEIKNTNNDNKLYLQDIGYNTSKQISSDK